jgi:transposase
MRLGSSVPKPRATSVTKAQFTKALRGTAGIKVTIAKRLNVHRDTIHNLLARADWDDVRAEYEWEVQSGVDAAERCILDAIKQRENPSLAVAAARWFLSRRRPEKYGLKRKVTVEGGDKPIQTQNLNMNANIPIEALNLPLETKRQILQALELKEQEEELKRQQQEQAIMLNSADFPLRAT